MIEVDLSDDKMRDFTNGRSLNRVGEIAVPYFKLKGLAVYFFIDPESGHLITADNDGKTAWFNGGEGFWENHSTTPWKGDDWKTVARTHEIMNLPIFLGIQREFLNSRRAKIRLHEQRKSEARGEPNKYVGKSPIQIAPGISFDYVYDKPESNPEVQSRPRQYHVDGWNVRGHWRHFKDGRKVFVKPYRKGKGSSDTTYVMKGVA